MSGQVRIKVRYQNQKRNLVRLFDVFPKGDAGFGQGNGLASESFNHFIQANLPGDSGKGLIAETSQVLPTD